VGALEGFDKLIDLIAKVLVALGDGLGLSLKAIPGILHGAELLLDLEELAVHVLQGLGVRHLSLAALLEVFDKVLGELLAIFGALADALKDVREDLETGGDKIKHSSKRG